MLKSIERSLWVTLQHAYMHITQTRKLYMCVLLPYAVVMGPVVNIV